MRTCISCKYKKKDPSDRVSYHSIPKEENMRRQWIAAMGKEEVTLSGGSKLCSLHFTKDCFFYPPGGQKKQRRIKPDAVPTIFGFHHSQLQRYVRTKKSKRSSKISPNDGTDDDGGDEEEDDEEENDEDDDETTDEYTSENLMESIAETERSCDFDKKAVLEISTDIRDIDDVSAVPLILDRHSDVEMDTKVDADTTVNVDDDNESHTVVTKEEISTVPRRYPEAPTKKWSRRLNPRYVGDCHEEDLKSPERAAQHWRIATQTIHQKNQKIAALQKQNKRLKKKIENIKSLMLELKQKHFITDYTGDISDGVPPECKELWKRQFDAGKRTKYPLPLKTFAMTLNFYSSAAYNYVRKIFMKSLPHPSIVRRWYTE